MTARVLVAGVGNVFLGDDGFGVEVARRLAAVELPPWARVADYGIRGMHLAYDLAGGEQELTILVDATTRGDAPGTVYVVELALKARICRTLKWASFETSGGLQSFKTHNLDTLLKLANEEGRCRACPTGTRGRWPCQIWRMAHEQLIGEGLPHRARTRPLRNPLGRISRTIAARRAAEAEKHPESPSEITTRIPAIRPSLPGPRRY